jgi:hypothetical protein
LDRRFEVDRPSPFHHENGDDRDLADEHRDKDQKAPERSAPELPDAGNGLRGRIERSGTCRIERMHQLSLPHHWNAATTRKCVSSSSIASSSCLSAISHAVALVTPAAIAIARPPDYCPHLSNALFWLFPRFPSHNQYPHISVALLVFHFPRIPIERLLVPLLDKVRNLCQLGNRIDDRIVT